MPITLALPADRICVRGDGPAKAKIALVGEQPGEKEVRLGIPYIGPAGEVLQECLSHAGLARAELYVTNVIKDLAHPLQYYFHFEKGKILSQHQDFVLYREYLKQELEEVDPNVIVATGNVALYALTGQMGIGKWRGSIIPCTLIPGKKVLPTYHPATVLPHVGQYTNKHLINLDLLRAKEQQEFPEIRSKQRNLIINPSYSDSLAYIAYLKERGRSSRLSFDIEVSRKTQELTCISFALSDLEAISIAFVDSEGDKFTPEQELEIWLQIAELLEDPTIPKLNQNIAFDIQFLFQRYGIKTAGPLDDTMIAQRIAWPDFPAGLDFICSFHTTIPYYKGDGKYFFDVGDWSKFWNYNAMDAIAVQEALPSLLEDVERQSNTATYRRQVALVPPLVYMMHQGINVDVQGMLSHQTRVKEEIATLEVELQAIMGPDVNYASPKQLITYWKETHGVDPYKKRQKDGTFTDTVDETALKRLSRRGFKEASLILQLRKLNKQLSTYLEIGKVDDDARYRSSYNPVGTPTGRLSSSENIFGTGGNQQNWPHELLKYFKADRGHLTYSVDLSQAENRIVAYVGRIPAMIEAFETGKDVHRLTASLIFNIPPEQISDVKGSTDIGGGKYSQRDLGKKANHSLNYGERYKKFALINEMAEGEAKFICERYHTIYPEVQLNYQALVKSMLYRDRTVINLMGRRRVFLGQLDEMLFLAAFAQIPQSTVADIINERGLNLIYYDPEFEPVELMTQIHDSIVFQLSLDLPWIRHAQIITKLKQSLETPLQFNDRTFVIPADFTIGTTLHKESSKELKSKNFPQELPALAEKLRQYYEELTNATTIP